MPRSRKKQEGSPVTGDDRKLTTRYAFRFRRLRFETLDVVIEAKPSDSTTIPMLEAHNIADRKRTVWTPDPEPYGYFPETRIEETARFGIASSINKELDEQTSGKVWEGPGMRRCLSRGYVVSLYSARHELGRCPHRM